MTTTPDVGAVRTTLINLINTTSHIDVNIKTTIIVNSFVKIIVISLFY